MKGLWSNRPTFLESAGNTNKRTVAWPEHTSVIISMIVLSFNCVNIYFNTYFLSLFLFSTVLRVGIGDGESLGTRRLPSTCRSWNSSYIFCHLLLLHHQRVAAAVTTTTTTLSKHAIVCVKLRNFIFRRGNFSFCCHKFPHYTAAHSFFPPT